MMKLNQALLKLGKLAWLLGLGIGFAGCGGSGNSNSSGNPTADSSATIIRNNGLQSFVPSYQIVVSPSGTATYTVYTVTGPDQQTTQTGGGALPASVTSKFFKDLAAAGPLSKLPIYTGGVSSLSQDLSVKYQGQMADLYGTGDDRAQTLADDSNAIAQALGLPTNAI